MVVTKVADGAKWGKRILAIGNACLPTAFIDNIADPSGAARLNALLRATEWTDSSPSRTGSVTVPLRTIWCAVGNVSALPAITARRVLPIRLQEGSRLTGAVRNSRPGLIVAALTILRAFRVAGCPDMGLEPLRPFTDWSNFVRETIVWLGLPDPVSTCRD